MNLIYSKKKASEIVGVSRQALDATHMDVLVELGIASEITTRLWGFEARNLAKYGEFAKWMRDEHPGTKVTAEKFNEWSKSQQPPAKAGGLNLD